MAYHPQNQALKNYKLKKAVSLVLALLVGFCPSAGAQHFAASVQRYGPENGLAHREVNAIFQDRRAFMWFGIRPGLNRFDGATFTTFIKKKNGLDFDDIRPFGCLMVTDQIASRYNDTVLATGMTHSAHPVSCAAALETLKIYEDNLIENAAKMGNYVAAQSELLKQKHPGSGDFRTTGLLGCFELVKNRTTKEPMAPFNAKPDEMAVMSKVAARIKELGMTIFVRWSYVFVAPPLGVTKERVDEGLAIISEA